jgi:hypothetical protein
LGLTFRDVVKATVFMDPKIDFPAMNGEFRKRFGSAAQPNSPARSAIKVSSPATPGALVEIEMIAVKKINWTDRGQRVRTESELITDGSFLTLVKNSVQHNLTMAGIVALRS